MNNIMLIGRVTFGRKKNKIAEYCAHKYILCIPFHDIYKATNKNVECKMSFICFSRRE